jgi:hypothetical protein
MKKLIVLFLVAALSVSSSGEILVYKYKVNNNPYVEWIDANNADVSVVNETGYLVLDVNDVNTGGLNRPATIIYYWTERDGGEVYKYYWSFDTGGGETELSIFGIGGKNKGMLIYLYWDNWDEAHCGLYGKCAKVDIGKGTKDKAQIPQSLKGTSSSWNKEYEAFGSMTMTLDSKFTKPANKVGEEKTQAETVADIIEALEEKGYEEY